MSTNKHNCIKLFISDYESLRPVESDDVRIDLKNYQHKIDKLMYAAIHTRPDISFAIKRLSQYLSDSAEHYKQALKTLLRYLRSTIDLGIIYGGLEISGSSRLKVQIFSDSDYAADRLNRKSILEYVYMFAEGPIAWMSRKQKLVAISTTEAEYMTLSTCVKEELWIAQLLRNMSLKSYLETKLNQVAIIENIKHEACSLMQLFENNQAVNLLIKDAYIHERSKHIDVAYYYIRNLYDKNLIQLNYASSADIIADELIKSLLENKFKSFVRQLELHELKISRS